MGQRVSTNLVRITAVGAGDGVAIGATGFVLYTLPVGLRAIIRKLAIRNQTGANANLLIGYGDRTVVGSIFRLIGAVWAVNNLPDFLTEDELPIFGNTPEGFKLDLTIPGGTTGDIIIETDSAFAAVLTPMGVIAEIELI